MARRPLARLLGKVVKQMKNGLSEATELLENKIRENSELTDHKLSALEQLGHPYSIRDPRAIHDPDFQVHKQTGRLAQSITVEKKVKGKKDTALVGVDDSIAPYVRHVIRGTKFMVARDFITGSFNQVNTQFTRIFAKRLKQGEDASTDDTQGTVR